MHPITKTPALYYAAENHRWEVVWYLLNAGARTSFTDYYTGITALYHVVCEGSLKLVQHFVNKGEDVRAVLTDAKLTLLHVAAGNGHLKMVEYLVNEDACVNGGVYVGGGDYVNDADASGATALYYAASGGHLNVVEYLVEHGAKVDSSSVYPPFFAAVENGHKSVVEYLLSQGADVNQEGELYDGLTPLCVAARNGRLEVTMYLVRVGYKEGDPLSYIRRAAEEGSSETSRESFVKLYRPVGHKQDRISLRSRARSLCSVYR